MKKSLMLTGGGSPLGSQIISPPVLPWGLKMIVSGIVTGSALLSIGSISSSPEKSIIVSMAASSKSAKTC